MKNFFIIIILTSLISSCAKKGCTDPKANNYDSSVKEDDGSCKEFIGDNHEGGIIFYLDGNGGGLIAMENDLDSSAQWGCVNLSINDNLVTTYLSNSIGSGSQNTILISDSINCLPNLGNIIAADTCVNHVDAYSDWFLPSKDELNLMYENIGPGNALGLGNIGNLSEVFYWSSSEFNANHAWIQDFKNGHQFHDNKEMYLLNVRAVRAF